ncbi:MAG: high frequency lysogenization protein HflD [Gammaproteobacteria bacterium]|nr:high frequency lysogenization protein HflD [Gammaproteobacteria bacterium]
MPYTQEDKTIALAGVFQAAQLVTEIARKGKSNQAAIESSLESLLRFDAPDVVSVFGDLTGVIQGLRTLQKQLDNTAYERNTDITRYAITIIHLQRKLEKDPAMLEQITSRLDSIKSQLDYFDLSHTNTIAKLADIYKSTISNMQPKIIVEGEQAFLSNGVNADKIRALLLAGIRSAVLWRQTGGSRLQLLFSRKKYFSSAKQLSEKIQ